MDGSRRCLQKILEPSGARKVIHNDSWQSCPSYRSAALRRMKRGKRLPLFDRCSGCVRRSRSVLMELESKTGSRKSTPLERISEQIKQRLFAQKRRSVLVTQNAGETGCYSAAACSLERCLLRIRACKHAPIFLCGSSADTGRNERRCPSTWRHTSREVLVQQPNQNEGTQNTHTPHRTEGDEEGTAGVTGTLSAPE